jgi:hypothetical protein
MAPSTTLARALAASGALVGAKRDGAFSRPARIAASFSEMSRADLPK